MGFWRAMFGWDSPSVIYTTYENAITYTPLGRNKMSYILVGVKPDVPVAQVKETISGIPDLLALTPDELRLYALLVLAADRNGMSFYHYDSICSLLEVPLEVYVQARNALIHKDLIAFDGTRFQVLSLPDRPVSDPSPALRTPEDFEAHDPATIRRTLRNAFPTASIPKRSER